MPTTVEFPMELDVVNPTNGNAFWSVRQGPFWDEGNYRFLKFSNPSSPSGDGTMNFKCNIPSNIAVTPAWDLVLHHQNENGNPGSVLIRVEALVLGSGDTPTQMTTIVPNKLVGVGASGDYNITRLSTSNFDSLVPLTAGEKLQVRITRIPMTTSGDSLVGNWDLKMAPLVRLDIA